MKIKEGGEMDFQKERELFLAHMRSIGSAGFMFELDEDGNFDDMSMAYAWSAWQAAKAQAVPEVISIGSELQSWVAVNSFGVEDAVGNLAIVDANELAELIEKLTGASQ